MRTLPIALVFITAAASAEVRTRYLTLEDAFVIQDISNPGSTTPYPVTGTFRWTYEVGDFANGTGTVVELDLPWWDDAGPIGLDTLIDTDQIEITMQGNYHDRGVDVTIVFDTHVTETTPADINLDQSQFHVEVGVSHQGHFISGRLVPLAPPACDADLTGDGLLDFFDIQAFLNAFATQDPIADANADTIFDFFDVQAFLQAFAAGCS